MNSAKNLYPVMRCVIQKEKIFFRYSSILNFNFFKNFNPKKIIGRFILPIFLILCYTQLNAQCDFSISENTPCGGTEVVFSTNSSDPGFAWDFDNDGIYDAFGNTVFYTFPILTTDENYVISLSLDSVACNTDTLLVSGVPDATIGVIPGTGTIDGNEIRVCSGAAQATLSIFNASTTYQNNQSYTINWGDGTSENYDNLSFSNSGFISHVYDGFGYYNLQLTVTGVNGCVTIEDYIFYNGSNPSVGLANPGNTVGLCIPATITFPITNTENNPAGTVYFIYISGQEVASYTQDNVPSSFTYTFTETSCGMSTSTGNYQNAFDVQIEAFNPCSSSQATIEPIELSAPPIPSMEISEPFPCLESSTFITNTSETFEVQNGNCSTNLAASWSITPGTSGIDWNILDGNIFSSNELELEFLLEGTYTITMVINSEDCGAVEISEEITIVTEGTPNANFELTTPTGDPNGDGCLPSVATFTNLSQGIDLTWYWFISPINGFEFIDSTTYLSNEATIQFTESGNYTITLFATNACTTVTWDTIITISDLPEIFLFETDDYCEEATLNFTGSDVYFHDNESDITSYYWEFPGATPSSSTDKRPTGIYYDTPGQYIITVEATNSCGTSSVTDTFNILQPETITLSPDTSVCIDASGFLLSANPSGGEWSGTGVSPDGWFDPSLGIVGANELVYDYSNAVCPTSSYMTVIIEDLPIVEAGPNQSVCENAQPFFISGGNPVNGVWTADNGGVIISNSVFDPQASGPGVYTLTYSYTDFNYCENYDEKIIIVNALPTVEAGPDISICDNPNDIQLTGHSPLGGSWSGVGVTPNGVLNLANTPGVGSYVLTYMITDPNTGCSNTDIITVTIIENPIADAGADQTVCISDGLLNLNSGTPTGGTWNGPGVNSAAGVFNPQIAGVGLHVLTYSFGQGICETTDEKVIYVEALPEITVPLGSDLCEGAPLISLSAATPIGGTWQGDGIQGNNFNPQIAGVGIHALTYYYTNPMTGCNNNKSIDMTVHAIPQLIVSDSIYCNTPGTVELPHANPPNGSWSGPGIINGSFDPQLAGGVGIYFLTYSYSNNYACSNTTIAQITVVPPPAIEAGPNDTFCIDNGLYQLDDFYPYGATWSGPGIVDSINGIFDPQLAGGGTHILTFSIGIGNCLVEDTRLIQVIDLTDAALGEGVEMCISDEPIYINVNGPPGGYWSGPGIIDINSGLFDPTIAGDGVHTLTYTYVNAAIGCNAFIVKDITVHGMQPPQIQIPDLGCINETIQLINNSPADYEVIWNFGDGETSTDFEPIHIFENLGNYNISIIAENQFGCIDSTNQDIFITEIPQPLFELDDDEGCAPLEINVTNQSTGFDVDFYWYFSNNISSNEANPGPVIFNQGVNDTIYYITLGAVNVCGASYYQDSILVHPQPVADFGISPESNCTPVVANFANVTTGSATSFFWNFGNGNTSTDSIPSPQTYFADTTTIYYTVTLTASNSCGSSTVTQQVEVDPADVQSFFSASATQGCQPLTIDFSDYSTPGANVDWVFGDGNTSVILDPTHTFVNPGTYTVIQYASSTCGYDSTTLEITVYPIPDVSFTNVLTACMGEEVSFVNNSIGTTGHLWDFGDGTFSNLNNPVHVFNAPGLYTITLTGISAFNQCPNEYQSEIIILDAPTAEFEISGQQGCLPFSIELTNNSIGGEFFEWSFGDGNFSVLENPTHTYYEAGTYPIALVVTDANGCFMDTTISNIIVHPNPEIDFEYQRLSLCGLPSEVMFQNNTQGASGFLWNFGDGNQSFLNSPTHTYYNEGDYIIQLIVSTPFGCKDSLEQELGIYPQPTANFDIETIQGCNPLQVFFNNESDQANNYHWTFGDNSESFEQSPLHVFDQAGLYDVQLIVSNDEVCFDTLRFEDAIEVLQNPLASFDIIENQNGSYQFVNQSDFANHYFWDFSDGTTSEDLNPSHRFLTNGIKQIYLEATSNNGCIDDTLINITPGFIKALYIPNGFSPQQGIGEVRLFKPKGVGIKEYHIQIFSTYGQLIWESRELKEGQPVESWDGTYGGTLLPQDVYVWKAAAIFEDGSAWQGVDNGNGGFKTMGSLILLR
jgi:large repetitive protein